MGKSFLIGTFSKEQGRCDGWLLYEDHEHLDQELKKFTINKENISYENQLKDKVFSRIALKRIYENPFSFLQLVLKYKMTNFWGTVAGLGFSIDSSRVAKYKSYIWAYAEIWHRVILSMFVFFIFRKLFMNKQTWDVRQIYVWTAILSTLLHTFLESHPRYHHMFIPLLVMYCSEITE